jgi:hypothetical protein
VSEPLDIGEAVEYILAERPALAEGDVWAVLMELGEPPAPGADDLALELVRRVQPALKPRDARAILREWRAYASLAQTEDDEDDW